MTMPVVVQSKRMVQGAAHGPPPQPAMCPDHSTRVSGGLGAAVNIQHPTACDSLLGNEHVRVLMGWAR